VSSKSREQATVTCKCDPVSAPKSTKSLVLRFVVVKLSVSIPFHIKDMEKEDLELLLF